MRKQYVFDQKGFLLVEHLISVIIVAILSIVIVYLLQVFSMYHINLNSLSHQEVHTLATRLRNEVRKADFLSSGNNQLRLYFNDTERIVTFSARNGRMLRQVNGSGGEIATYNLYSMDVYLINDQAANLRLISLEGDIFYIYVTILRLPNVSIDSVAFY